MCLIYVYTHTLIEPITESIGIASFTVKVSDEPPLDRKHKLDSSSLDTNDVSVVVVVVVAVFGDFVVVRYC